MTAFDNIKVNNWPATSNDFEDFLVLKMPLNDNASLTESLPVVAGSKELLPKRTLANTGVAMEAFDSTAGTTINIAASEYSTSGTVSNAANLFDGNTSTTVSSADGARIYWTPASNISVTKFEVYFSNAYSGYKIGVEVTGGSSQVITKSNPGNSPGWVEFTSIAGDTIGPSNQIKFRSYRSNDTDPGILGISAVRVNDKIVTTASGGAPKKHYDNNADFSGNGKVTVSGDNFVFGVGDYTVEMWVYHTASGAQATYFGDTYGSTAGIYFYRNSSNKIGVYYSSQIVTGGTSIPTNSWVHVAAVRNAGTTTVYVNGSSDGSGADTTNLTVTDYGVGETPGGNSGSMEGFIQDVRVYKGVAKYTSNFTPPGAILG